MLKIMCQINILALKNYEVKDYEENKPTMITIFYKENFN